MPAQVMYNSVREGMSETAIADTITSDRQNGRLTNRTYVNRQNNDIDINAPLSHTAAVIIIIIIVIIYYVPMPGKSTSTLAGIAVATEVGLHVRGFRILFGVSTTEFICASGCANFRTAGAQCVYIKRTASARACVCA